MSSVYSAVNIYACVVSCDVWPARPSLEGCLGLLFSLFLRSS